MKQNDICPYCSAELLKAENKPNSRSREHVIADGFFAQRRGMGLADFYCCRQCNSGKSEMDYIFAAISRIQPSAEIAVEEVEKVL